MLADSRVSAVLPVVDLERASKFYEEKLGLQTINTTGGVMLECAQGSKLVLYQRDSPTKADHTAAGWEVNDVEKVVNDPRIPIMRKYLRKSCEKLLFSINVNK